MELDSNFAVRLLNYDRCSYFSEKTIIIKKRFLYEQYSDLKLPLKL